MFSFIFGIVELKPHTFARFTRDLALLYCSRSLSAQDGDGIPEKRNPMLSADVVFVCKHW